MTIIKIARMNHYIQNYSLVSFEKEETNSSVNNKNGCGGLESGSDSKKNHNNINNFQ